MPVNGSRRPAPPSLLLPRPTAKVSFYTPDTLHNICKRSSSIAPPCVMTRTPQRRRSARAVRQARVADLLRAGLRRARFLFTVCAGQPVGFTWAEWSARFHQPDVGCQDTATKQRH